MFFIEQCVEEDEMAMADEVGGLEIQLLSDKGTLPSKANRFDAGFDLYASENVLIRPKERSLISTDVAMAIPKGHVGLIWPRSGLAVKHGVDVFAGVIDSGYRGEVKVCLYNSDSEILEVREGDRIAQLLIQKVENYFIREVESLDDSERGDQGFGSSGK
jgi:dUTP pyrophosphatase